MTDPVLTKLGLTAEQVRKAFGTPEPPPFTNRDLSGKNYLNGRDQQRIHRRLQIYEGFIYARYIEGYHPGTIGRILNVSEEAVRTRIRNQNIFTP